MFSQADVRRVTLKQMTALPTPALRLIAGGGVIYRGGRTLDPRFQALPVLWREGAFYGGAIESARHTWRQAQTLSPPLKAENVRTLDVVLDGSDGDAPARLHVPAQVDAAAPMLVLGPDGAGVVGDAASADTLASHLAMIGKTPVLVPALRAAPEHRFPAGLEDLEAALRWAQAHGGDYGALPGLASIGGLGPSGGLAASLSARLKAEDSPQPHLLILIHPILDAGVEASVDQEFNDAWPLSCEGLRWLYDHLLEPDTDPSSPEVSPLRLPDLTGMPSTVVIGAGFDPTADQALNFARRLKTAGVAVTARRYDTLPHGFSLFARLCETSASAVLEIAGLYRAALEGRFG